MPKPKIQILILKVLLKVNDCVNELSSALGIVTESACLVLKHLLGSPHSEVPQELSLALHANLNIGVPVEFSYIFRRNPTLAMETINVLTHYELKIPLIHHRNHCHMSWGRDCLLN
jgi:hypothetical protein